MVELSLALDVELARWIPFRFPAYFVNLSIVCWAAVRLVMFPVSVMYATDRPLSTPVLVTMDFALKRGSPVLPKFIAFVQCGRKNNRVDYYNAEKKSKAMPLETEKGPSYVKVTKIHVDSRDRDASDSASSVDYVVNIPQNVQYVIGCEVTAVDLPIDITPSFLAAQGNTYIDFELTTGGVTTQFSAQWPERRFTYQDLLAPSRSYVTTLQNLLQEAVRYDADFGDGQANEATITVTPTADETTRVTVSGTGITGIRFLFATGTNAANSAWAQMGFTQADTVSALENLGTNPVDLDTYRHVDINIEEFQELKPLERVYVSDGSGDVVINSYNLSRLRMLTDPVHRLRRLQVKLTLKGGVSPPGNTNQEHGFTLTVFSLSNETSVPEWVRQVFVL